MTKATKPSSKKAPSDKAVTGNTAASKNPVGKTDAAHQQGVHNQEAKFAQLVDHSYLTEKGFDVVAESLQRNLATTISLYLKLKKFHWDIRGRHFRDLHLAYDDFIAKIFPGIDEQAERLVMLGGSPVAAPSDIAKYSVVAVPTETIHDAREQVAALVADLTKVARGYRDDSKAVDDAGDPATSDIYNGILHVIDEVRWMLQAMMDDARLD
jgi:starvation-inducible DNA-binding protein